jgi:hypothetical protein
MCSLKIISLQCALEVSSFTSFKTKEFHHRRVASDSLADVIETFLPNITGGNPVDSGFVSMQVNRLLAEWLRETFYVPCNKYENQTGSV